MGEFGLEEVIGELMAYDSIMAGDWRINATRKLKRRAKLKTKAEA